MKNLKQHWLNKTLVLLLLVFLYTNCSKDDEPQAPVINEISTQTDYNLNDNSIAQKGKDISVKLLNFNPDESEFKFSLGGVDCEFLFFNNSGDAVIRVPDNALAGNLVMKVGGHNVTWPEPIRLVDPPVINAFVESDTKLVKEERFRPNNYKEVGTVFTPMVNGTIVALGLKIIDNTSRRVTLWNVDSKANIASLVILGSSDRTVFRQLETPISVKAGEKYIISMFDNSWYNYKHSPLDNMYPILVSENITLENLAATGRYDKLNDNYDFPDEDIQTVFIALGADFVFVPDIE